MKPNSSIKRNKKTISILSLILMLTMILMTFVQPGLAQIGITMPEKTTGYIDVAPHLLGVGQNATVNLFIYPIPTNYVFRPYFLGYFGITVTFIKPDGTKDTFMPVDGTGMYKPGQCQSLGTIFFYYKPDMAGNWSVSFTMPDQNITDTTGNPPYGSVLMKGCTSGSAYFTVQADPVLAGLLNGYPWSPLPDPNVYWSYPISSNNREWNQISGDWLGATSTGATVNSATARLWQPYGPGPNTGHIVWKQPLRLGGIIGGDYGSLSYGASGSTINSVIIQGKLFVNIPSANKFECIDLATGEVLYTANGTFSYGLHYSGTAYQQSTPTNLVLLESSYGNYFTPYLFESSGTTWNYYDPFTGTLMRSLTNCSSARFIDGSWLAFGTASGNLFRWNYSSVPTSGTKANNWTAGIEWSKPLPVSLSGTNPSMLGISSDASTLVLRAIHQFWGYSAKDGTLIWNITLPYPITSNEEICLYPVNDFIVYDATESTFHCYSMITGAELWESTSFSDSVWATTWTVYYSETSDNNNFYAMFPDCTVRAYSLKDGHEVWRSKAILSTEYPNNAVPYVENMVMVGGKIYCCAGYSPMYKINPIPRQGMIVCIDATTGDTVFTLNGGLRPSSAANGYVIGTGDFDGNIYALGKGPTQTKVTTPLTTVSAGTSVIIQGSVMDISPASQDYASQVRFANGVPAVADDSMSEWMDYLHMQNATLLNDPPKPNGVTVRLAAVDSTGQVTDLGTATSDYTGQFALQWTPTTEDTYKIFATFDGSNSYYGSYAETSLGIGKAPTETSTQQQITIPDYTMTIIGAAIAIMILVAIVGIVLYRKK